MNLRGVSREGDDGNGPLLSTQLAWEIESNPNTGRYDRSVSIDLDTIMSHNAINKGFHAARVVQKRMLSPTVCWIHLDVSQHVESMSTSTLSFAPGQWVDFVVPGLRWVGGFSLVSDPADLPVLSLAVRLGLRSPTAGAQAQSSSKQQLKKIPLPSTWVHDESKVGSNVEVRVGGTCILQPQHSLGRPVVFCAGGIGIVTMLSLYRAHFQYQNELYLRQLELATTGSGGLSGTHPPPSPSPTTLFYSASTQEEMVFADELIDLVSTYGTQARGDRIVLALTQQAAWKHTGTTSRSTSNAEHKVMVDRTSDKEDGLIEYRTGREMRNFLSEQADDSVYYLCGPPAMIDEAARFLEEDCGVPQTDIIYEKWW
jgi:ferredoxin-NADP reductase